MPAVSFWTLVLLSAAWLMSAAPAYAECILPGKEIIKSPRYELVFDGTVLDLRTAVGGNGDVATVKVHRVWKGQLPAQIELYASAGLEYPRVQVGHRYVLAINRMPPPGFATLTPALVYVTMMCGGVERDVLQRNGMLAAFGRGRPPGR
jgi:hypothetical protein